MSYQIYFSILAREDLVSIKKYICGDNFEVAQKVVRNIIEYVEVLKENPSLGRSGRVLHTRELIVPKSPYIVPYQFRDGAIYVLRILHSARKWDL